MPRHTATADLFAATVAAAAILPATDDDQTALDLGPTPVAPIAVGLPTVTTDAPALTYAFARPPVQQSLLDTDGPLFGRR